MATFKLEYTGSEAVEMIKSYHPEDWQKRIEVKKIALLSLAKRHNISIEKAYRKFIMPVAGNHDSIIFFAALSELIKFEKMSNRDKANRVAELEEKREGVASQIVSLEICKSIDYEDKKILRAYYVRLQQETTREITELLESFEVVEPKLVIYQPGLFG